MNAHERNITNRLARIETRLVKLMLVLGIDPYDTTPTPQTVNKGTYQHIKV